jgi:hypothetical protein
MPISTRERVFLRTSVVVAIVLVLWMIGRVQGPVVVY